MDEGKMGQRKSLDQQVADLKNEIKRQKEANARLTRDKSAFMGGGIAVLRSFESQLRSLVGSEQADRILLEINQERVAEQGE